MYQNYDMYNSLQYMPQQNYLQNNLQGNQFMNRLPRMELPMVHGENGAQTFANRMSPNSSVIVGDDTDDRVWLIKTDSAGYPTLCPLRVILERTEPSSNSTDLEKRIKALEEKLNVKSDNGSTESAESDA